MIRNVRNFWLELYVDGRKRGATGPVVATGPIRADGGFSLRVCQRHQGDVTQAGYLIGTADKNGKLVLMWENARADEIVLKETER